MDNHQPVQPYATKTEKEYTLARAHASLPSHGHEKDRDTHRKKWLARGWKRGKDTRGKQRESSMGTGREGGERRMRHSREGHRVEAEQTNKQSKKEGTRNEAENQQWISNQAATTMSNNCSCQVSSNITRKISGHWLNPLCIYSKQVSVFLQLFFSCCFSHKHQKQKENRRPIGNVILTEITISWWYYHIMLNDSWWWGSA